MQKSIEYRSDNGSDAGMKNLHIIRFHPFPRIVSIASRVIYVYEYIGRFALFYKWFLWKFVWFLETMPYHDKYLFLLGIGIYRDMALSTNRLHYLGSTCINSKLSKYTQVMWIFVSMGRAYPNTQSSRINDSHGVDVISTRYDVSYLLCSG